MTMAEGDGDGDGEVERRWMWQWTAALTADAAVEGGGVVGCRRATGKKGGGQR